MDVRFWNTLFIVFVISLTCLSSCCSSETVIKNEVCNVKTEARFDCFPEGKGLTLESCTKRGCCYRPILKSRDSVPWCYYPQNYCSYNVASISATVNSIVGLLKHTGAKSHLPNVIETLKFNITYETSSIARIRITDANNPRYEVPILPAEYDSDDIKAEKLYSIEVHKNSSHGFGISLSRLSTKATLFNTTIAPLFFADQFLQMSTSLASTHVFGLGERHGNLHLDVNWNRFPFWARDQIPVADANLYGDHPFFMAMGEDGNTYGMMFLNSNAKEAELQPLPAITWRSIGGILDFYVFAGPSPADVVRQYTSVIGRSFMPPLWSLGFHLCRWGYKTANTTLDYVKKMRDGGFPQDVQWNDIDYMHDHLDFTYDQAVFGDLPSLVNNLHLHGQHYMMIVDPGISNTNKSYTPYKTGHTDDIFIKTANDSEVVGEVWPGNTVFPDFSNCKTTAWWYDMLKMFSNEVKFDGVWIDMNEPSNFMDGDGHGCSNSSLDHPPYVPPITDGKLSSKTLCPSSKQAMSTHYNLHSLTGMMEQKATSEALVKLRNKRPFSISRSTFMGSGRFGGHWTGDVRSTWEYLAKSVPSILMFNMYGIPMVGADICGFGEATNEELCTRWSQLGAFYPFSRNHNDKAGTPQAPVDFPQKTQNIIRHAFQTRYALMPYLYTLFHYAHVNGSTVARPLFFEFPNDKNTFDIDNQFMWGSSLLISPVLTPKTDALAMYFPPGVWYSFYTIWGERVKSLGERIIVNAPISEIPLFIRGGSIIPGMFSETITSTSYPYWIFVAPDDNDLACGSIFMDDGETLDTYETGDFVKIQMMLNHTNLSIYYESGSLEILSSRSLMTIFVSDVTKKPSKVLANGSPVFFMMTNYINVLEILIDKPFEKLLEVTWSFD